MKFFLSLCLFALLGALGLGLAAVGYVQHVYRSPGPHSEALLVEVERGMGLSRIADTLLEARALQGGALGADYFVYGTLLAGYRGQLKAGEYEIASRASMAEIARQMAEGRVLEHSITIPEGLTVPQIVARLKGEGALTGEVTTLPPEGSLMPETYQFLKGDTRASVLARMQEAKAKLVAELWAQRAPGLPLKTPLEAVTLASIVEKETGVAPERAKVAGVFINRLRLGMKLQSDPTTIYAVTNGTGELGRELYLKDLRVEHPYNTYHIAGLPPGPIANPGRASLAAVLNPESHQYLYFVADGTGGHAFARTLAEHNQNVAKWRKIERKREQDRR